jgi:hypothetical protein
MSVTIGIVTVGIAVAVSVGGRAFDGASLRSMASPITISGRASTAVVQCVQATTSLAGRV